MFKSFYKNRPERTPTLITTPSLTRQAPADMVNVNSIIKKYGYGLASQTNEQPIFMDCSSLDYRASLDRILEVEERFMELSAFEREKFGNDPENWLASFQETENDSRTSSLLDITGTTDTATSGVEEKKEIKEEVK